jgi:hypothetical protein
MTKHHEWTDSVHGNIYQHKYFAALSFISVNMEETTKISGVGCGYVDSRMISFHILNGDWTQEISVIIHILPGPQN